MLICGFGGFGKIIHICIWVGFWDLVRNGKITMNRKNVIRLVAHHGEKLAAALILKMARKFTLYAKVAEKVNTNCLKMVAVFPLYAKMVEKVNQNREKRASGKKREMTHYFPLICKSGEIS